MPLNYDEFRAIVKDGDVFFLTVDKSNPLSRLTAYITKSEYTHAAFAFWYKDRLLVAESTNHGGSRIGTASHYSNRGFAIVRAPRHWEDIATDALTRSGESGYGWFSAAYIGIRQWMLVNAGIKLPRWTDNKDKACSEYVAEVLGLEDPDISPGELWDQLQTINKD